MESRTSMEEEEGWSYGKAHERVKGLNNFGRCRHHLSVVRLTYSAPIRISILVRALYTPMQL